MDNNQPQDQGQNSSSTPQYVFSDNSGNTGGFTQTFAMGDDGQNTQTTEQPTTPPAPTTPIPTSAPPAAGVPTPPPTGTDPAVAPKAKEDDTPAHYKLGQYIKPIKNIVLPPNNLQFDQDKFLMLLAGSISLSKDEKKKIIASLPKLRQQQVDELIRIFEEEQRKFADLSKKHVTQLDKLAKEHAADWEDIELEYVAQSNQESEAAEADEIRKQLGL